MDVQHNLYLRTDARVSRVIFEGNKAVGVAYVPSKNRVHGGEIRETIVCYSFRLPLELTLKLAAGQGSQVCRFEQRYSRHSTGNLTSLDLGLMLANPKDQILERSGVGSSDLLKKLGIKVVSDLPGVGEQYQDHYTTLSSGYLE
jgi:alcohol oxidase